jgi:hypothetical protein
MPDSFSKKQSIKNKALKQKEKDKKNKYQNKANTTQVLAKTKDFLVNIFYGDQTKTFLKTMLKFH